MLFLIMQAYPIRKGYIIVKGPGAYISDYTTSSTDVVLKLTTMEETWEKYVEWSYVITVMDITDLEVVVFERSN